MLDFIHYSLLWGVAPLTFLPFILIFAIVGVWIAGRNDTEHMTHVEFLGWRDVYTEGTENTGFSYGTDGAFRTYYGNVRRYAGRNAVFYVEYSNKNPRSLSVQPGSRKFDKLVKFMENQK